MSLAKLSDYATWVGWNTFLALIPVGLSYLLFWIAQQEKVPRYQRTIAFILVGIVWLTFLPNTCYLLTEWRHFFDQVFLTALYRQWHVQNNLQAPLQVLGYWFFYLAFSALGAFTFTLAIRPIRRLLNTRVQLWLLAPPFFFLMSLGVYLGLKHRYNSWEIVTKPQELLQITGDALANPMLFLLICAFAVTLWLVYLFVNVWVEGFIIILRRYSRPGAS